MSDDTVSGEDQAAIDQLAQGAMQLLAAGRTVDEVSRDLQANGLAKSTADGLAEHLQQRWQQVAAAPRANADVYFRAKYPEMRPARSAPTLFTMHGVGTMLWGQRDRDAATGTFVKTQCFCVFFMPVLAFKAYRVAPNGSGWTLIGRVPLSRFARWWNVLLPLAVAIFIGFGMWDAAKNSPAAVAARTMARGDQAAAEGKLVEASRLYAQVAHGRTEHAAAARERCVKLVGRPEVDNLPPAETVQLFGQVVEFAAQCGQAQQVLDRGLALVKQRATADPIHATQLLSRLAVLSRSDACTTFAKLVEGPLAQLAPADAVSVFREAAQIPQDAPDKSAFIALATKQSARIASTDLPGAFDVLSVVAGMNERDSIDDCLTTLLGAPFDKAPCDAISKAIGIGKGFVGPANETKLFNAGITWIDRHRSVDPKDLFALLDQLAALEGADPARVAAARRPLLEKLLAANPQDVDLTVQLALAIEAEGKRGNAPGSDDNSATQIIKLLSPLRDKLGVGEGARALGQALAVEGKYDESYALLAPYLDQRLDAFHAADDAYIAALKECETRVWDQLRHGNAPGFDFARANRMSEKEAQALAVEYTSQRIKDDSNVNAAREALVRQSMVVPAALDLGMVMLQRAQTMKDPALRRDELQRAEKTFLAIRGTAGEADQYMLRLGQVYYWLGKQAEGQQEFDKLLAKHQRKAEMLHSLAGVLRQLGEMNEARTLLEEAYEKSSDPRFRHEVAETRAITSKDIDDEILWLERCDADSPHVKALLAESRGRRAESQGKDDEAATDYREAAAIYEKEPVSSAMLNNGALAYMALFEVSGDRQAFERASQRLEKAVSLSPSDSLVVANAANQMLRAAVQDLAGSRLNLRELQVSGSLDSLRYLAANEHDLEEIRDRARNHSGLRKALNYLERALVLAPKSQSENLQALQVYGFLRDREALNRLADRLKAAKPDTQESIAESLQFYQFHETSSTKEAMRAQIARGEALVSRLSRGEKGPAYAVAATNLVDLKLMLPADEADPDQLVSLAEEAHRAAPSLATYVPLVRALFHRAGIKLAADYPEYASATKGTSRAVSASYELALALERNDALGKAARENRDVQRAIAFTAERAEAFPESRDSWTWSVLAAAQPSRSELRAKCLAHDNVRETLYDVTRILAPASSSEAFEAYFQLRASGDANPRAPLDELAKLGVPLPLGLIQK